MENGWLSKKLSNRVVAREAGRDYIGASSIGSDCLRQIYYDFNNKDGETIPAKLQRTFDIGSTLEGLVVEWLKECGLSIAVPCDTNNYLEYSDPGLKYFKGHCDALILQPMSILEIKTAKDASFKLFCNKGCLVWNSRYYAQLQSYMGASGIHKSTILVLNKDTSETFDEVVKFDQSYYELLLIRAEMIFKAKEPPPRVNNSPFWYQCKMCRYKGICHD
jgi:hypothetical protein